MKNVRLVMLRSGVLKFAFLLCAGLALSGCGTAQRSDPEPDLKVSDVLRKNAAEGENARVSTASTSAQAPVERGELRGRFVYDGPPPKVNRIDTSKEPLYGGHEKFDERLLVKSGGGLKNVLIFVVTKDVAPPTASTTSSMKTSNNETPVVDARERNLVILSIEKCSYEPRILPFVIPATLEVRNGDGCSHNASLSSDDKSFDPGSTQFRYERSRSVPIEVTCSIHPWMKSYVLPRDNPYFAVSDEDGTFEIKDVPAGKLEFQVWHEAARGFRNLERKGWTKGRFMLQIKPGENDLGEIKFDPKLFEPARL